MLVAPVTLISNSSDATTKKTVVATTSTTTTLATVPVVSTPLVAPEIMAKWEKVAQCEQQGNWHFKGSVYDGGLGIMRGNWYAYGGRDFALEAHLATPEQQVVVAQRIQAYNGYAGYVPDQDGMCRGW